MPSFPWFFWIWAELQKGSMALYLVCLFFKVYILKWVLFPWFLVCTLKKAKILSFEVGENIWIILFPWFSLMIVSYVWKCPNEVWVNFSKRSMAFIFWGWATYLKEDWWCIFQRSGVSSKLAQWAIFGEALMDFFLQIEHNIKKWPMANFE